MVEVVFIKFPFALTGIDYSLIITLSTAYCLINISHHNEAKLLPKMQAFQ